MSVDYRRSGGRIPYEDGIDFALSYPDFDTPQARLLMMRNPSAGTAYESSTLAQDVTQTATRRIVAASIADVASARFSRSWSYMEPGWTQGQRISSTGVITATTSTNVSGATDYLVSFGFRSFDGSEPTVQLVQLDGADLALASDNFTFSSGSLRPYPRGATRRIEMQITSEATTAKLQIKATSAGEDFLICDLHAMQSDGTDSWAESDQLLDTDGDGRGDAWATSSGTPTLEWYGQGAAGLEQWIILVAEGALNTHEFRKEGSGHVETVRIAEPTENVGFPRHESGQSGPVRVTFFREDA